MISVWEERVLYWPPPPEVDALRGKNRITLKRDDEGVTWWVILSSDSDEERKVLAVRNDPATAVARMRQRAALRDAARKWAEEAAEAVKAAQKALTEACDRAHTAAHDAELAEWEVLLLLRRGELPEVPRG